MFGAIAKTYYAEKIGVKPEDMVVVSVMPCTAKKYEAARPEMNDSGVRDVDIVLTTRELGALIKQAGIDFRGLHDEQMDAPLGISTGAADIFANTGGVMEAALRTVWEIVTETPFPFPNLHVEPIVGLEGVKMATVKVEGAKGDWAFLEGADLKVGVAHGLGNAQKLIDRVKSGEIECHFVEVMTCPGGCIGGGGQPRFTTNEVRKARMARDLPRGRGPRGAQVARERGRLRPVRRVPRGAVRRDLAPPAAHALLRARPRLKPRRRADTADQAGLSARRGGGPGRPGSPPGAAAESEGGRRPRPERLYLRAHDDR